MLDLLLGAPYNIVMNTTEKNTGRVTIHTVATNCPKCRAFNNSGRCGCSVHWPNDTLDRINSIELDIK